MSEKPKNQGNKTSGIFLIVFAVAIFLGVGVTVPVALIASGVAKDNMGMMLTLIPVIIMFLFIIILGVAMFIKGKKSETIKKTGRKSVATIFNIVSIKNGHQMIVTYKGDSGKEYKHMLYVNRDVLASFRPDMKIECYVSGEDCYVDPNNLVEVKDTFDEEF